MELTRRFDAPQVVIDSAAATPNSRHAQTSRKPIRLRESDDVLSGTPTTRGGSSPQAVRLATHGSEAAVFGGGRTQLAERSTANGVVEDGLALTWFSACERLAPGRRVLESCL